MNSHLQSLLARTSGVAVLWLTTILQSEAQTITFYADSWPGELTSCIVTFNGDTVFNVSNNAVLWPGGANTSSNFSVATYGAGDYTVTMNDTFGDGGSAFSVDGGPLNCMGECSGSVPGGGPQITTWAFTLTSGIPGCTDVTALNYEGNATVDDGSCVFPNCSDGQTLVQFMMFDTLGDGWDGTTYTLTDASGTVVASGSLDAAQFIVEADVQGSDFFCLSTTDCYVLELAGGFFPAQKEWQIIDYNTGELLYDQTDNNGFGVFGVSGSGVACGCTDSTAFNYDADATADDGSCFVPSCDASGTADSTSYILHLNHDIYLYWGNNAAFIYEAGGDTILNAGLIDGLYAPDYEGSVVDGYWEFCIPSDACLQFFGGGGSPAGLPIWEIMDFSGNILHTGGLGVYDIGFGTSADNCVSGCTLSAAINYDPAATIDDESCVVCDNGQLGLYLTLQDDFATGWSPGNDYYLVDESSGDTVLTGTMASGPTTTEVINCLDIGCYTFSTGAIFGTEGWGIADNTGVVYAPLTYGPAEGYPIAFGTSFEDCASFGCSEETACNYDEAADVDDGSCLVPGPGQSCCAAGVLFSEFGEGPANDTYLEVFNASQDTVLLDAFAVGRTANQLNLEGGFDFVDILFPAGTRLSPGSTYLIVESGATAPLSTLANLTVTEISSGDDALGLIRLSDGLVVDQIGVPQTDEGLGWTVNGISNATYNRTILRNSGVSDGNGGDWSSSSGADGGAGEWSVLPGFDAGDAGLHTHDGLCAGASPHLIRGCTNPLSCVYDEEANAHVESMCDYESCYGCLDPQACTYSPTATFDVPSACLYAVDLHGSDLVDCDGICLNDADGDGICDEEEPADCMEPGACNYNPIAEFDDGSCEYLTCAGCTDSSGCNYDPTATLDAECDYSCVTGCTEAGACNYDEQNLFEDGSCDYACVTGCTDPFACNYGSLNIYDDGSCEFTSCLGCTDPDACNFAASAIYDDGSCSYGADADGNGVCDEDEGCTNPLAANYNPNVTVDDGSCCGIETNLGGYGIEVEMMAEDIGLVVDAQGIVDLTGYDTYRVYITMENENDFLSAISGDTYRPTTITSTTDFYQSLLGGATPNAINPVLFSSFPDLEYDSWVTIGLEQFPDAGAGEANVSTVQSGLNPWAENFENGGGVIIDDEVGGAWFALNGDANGVAGSDLRVLCGQFTTSGELSVELYTQIFIEGQGTNALVVGEFDHPEYGLQDLFPTFVWNSVEPEGCTDVSACNYDGTVCADDGSCVYPESYFDCSGNCINDSNNNGICDEVEASGCLDDAACNYDATAEFDDDSCLYPLANYVDCDGNCLNDSDGNGVCDEEECPLPECSFTADWADTVLIACDDSCFTLSPGPSPFRSTSVYEVDSIAYTPPLALGTGTVQSTPTNGYTGNIPLPFGFSFFDTDFFQLKVSRKGFLTFDTGLAAGYNYPDEPLGSESLPPNSVMAPYAYISNSGGEIRTATLGEFPNRKFVVSWENLPQTGCSVNELVTQVVLFESTNVVEMHIGQFEACLGITAAVGIQGEAGEGAFGPSDFDTGEFVLLEQAFRIAPSGPPLAPYFFFSENGFEGQGDSLELCGLSAQSIVVRTPVPVIEQTSAVFECGVPSTTCDTSLVYDVNLGASETESIDFEMNGTVIGMAVTSNWTPSGGSWPGDMGLQLCDPSGNCGFVEGFNIDQGGVYLGDWPSNWNTTLGGFYESCIDIPSGLLSGDGTWTVTVQNGWSAAAGGVSFTGTITLFTDCIDTTSFDDAGYGHTVAHEIVLTIPEELDLDGDGVCDPFEFPGCTDPEACNWAPVYTEEDGSCYYAQDGFDCNGFCLPVANDECGTAEPIACSQIVTATTVCADTTETTYCDQYNIGQYFHGGLWYSIVGTGDTLRATMCFENTGYDSYLSVFEGDCDNLDCVAGNDDQDEANFFAEPCYENFLASAVEWESEEGVEYLLHVSGSNAVTPAVGGFDFVLVCDGVEVGGCLDSLACNYNPDEVVDGNNCLYPNDLYGSEYVDCDGVCFIDTDGDGVCDEDEIPGCLDDGACNYDPEATDYDVDLCDYVSCAGCTDAQAVNFDPEATLDDGSCDYCAIVLEAPVVTAASCFGGEDGSIEVLSWSGANGEVQFILDGQSAQTEGTFDSLMAGTYQVYVMDELECVDSATAVVEQPPLIEADVEWAAPICAGASDGQLAVSPVGGGTGNLMVIIDGEVYDSIDWSVPAGVYEVVLQDELGCEVGFDVEVTEPDSVFMNLTSVPPDCYGGLGQILALAQGGTGTIGYGITPEVGAAEPGQFEVGAGTYVVEAFDENGCSVSGVIEVTEPDVLTLTVTGIVEAHPVLAGGAVTLSPNGGTPDYEYLWSGDQYYSNAPNPSLLPGTYDVLVTDANGCTSQLVDIEVPVVMLPGCTNEAALNFDPAATVPDGSCLYEGCSDLTSAGAFSDIQPGIVEAFVGEQLNRELALFSGDQIEDSASGTLFSLLTMDIDSAQGLPEGLTLDVGTPSLSAGQVSCLALSGLVAQSGTFEVQVWTTVTASVFGQPFAVGSMAMTFELVVEDSPFDIPGCTYPSASNYSMTSTLDDGSCEFPGCTNEEALNFDAYATMDNSSCIFMEDVVSDNCIADLDGSGFVGAADLLLFLTFYEVFCD